MVVKSYRTCDICGKKLVSKDVEELNYRIEPRSKIRMSIWGYSFSDPNNSFWTEGLDICKDCWKDMKEWIKDKKGEN